MTLLQRYAALSVAEQVLVAQAVLIDGFDAAEYLGNDIDRGSVLAKFAREFTAMPNEVRTPLLATMMRRLLNEHK
ncbi:MAG: hypothetical protein IT292_01770 [Deltaproteobacteria bacterium]|nr:hypothetical protein [Deltaproteobacteria bacterium]